MKRQEIYLLVLAVALVTGLFVYLRRRKSSEYLVDLDGGGGNQDGGGNNAGGGGDDGGGGGGFIPQGCECCNQLDGGQGQLDNTQACLFKCNNCGGRSPSRGLCGQCTSHCMKLAVPGINCQKLCKKLNWC